MATNLPFPTINVVPAGFRWSADAAKKAGDKGAFLRVGGTQVTRRFLSGAKRSWTSAKPEEQQTIFHTGFRITGTPEAITTALSYAGVPADQIQQVLATSITRDNYNTTMAQTVQEELQKHAAAKQAKPVTEGYDPQQILWFAQNIKTAVIATKTGEQKGAVASPGRAGAGESLSEKIKKLAQGKVLDVSNMDINTGKGVRTVTAPKTAKSGKFGTGRVPIISNDINKYVKAIELAYGAEGPATYAADVQVVRQALANAGGPALVGTLGTGVVPRMPSPAQVPGTVLAAPPQFVPAQGQATVVPKVASPRVGTMGGTNLPGIPALQGLLQ
jgi:hypothetical protein